MRFDHADHDHHHDGHVERHNVVDYLRNQLGNYNDYVESDYNTDDNPNHLANHHHYHH